MVVNIKVQKLSEINVKHVNIKKPIIYPHNGTILFDIYYKNEWLMLDIQGTNISNKNKNITFIDSTVQNMRELEQLSKDITDRVKSNSKYNEYFKGKQSYCMINDRSITFKNVCEYDTVVFDMMERKIDMMRLKVNDNVRILIYLKNLWINDKYFGINIKLSQIQRIEPLGLNKYLFVNTNIPVPPKPPPLLGKKSPAQISNPKFNKVVRPSLNDILNSRENLRKTNLLS